MVCGPHWTRARAAAARERGRSRARTCVVRAGLPQANASDRAVGLLFLLVSTVVFLYYTVWVLVLVRPRAPRPPPVRVAVAGPRLCAPARSARTGPPGPRQPFVDEDKGIHHYFLPYHYAVLVPSALLAVGLTGVLSFLALVMIKSKASKTKKQA